MKALLSILITLSCTAPAFSQTCTASVKNFKQFQNLKITDTAKIEKARDITKIISHLVKIGYQMTEKTESADLQILDVSTECDDQYIRLGQLNCLGYSVAIQALRGATKPALWTFNGSNNDGSSLSDASQSSALDEALSFIPTCQK